MGPIDFSPLVYLAYVGVAAICLAAVALLITVGWIVIRFVF